MSSKRFGAILVAVLVSLLAFLVGANFYLFNLSRRYYELFNRTRLDPLGLDIFTNTHDPVDQQDAGIVRVAFFGDSRVAEWPMPDLEGYAFINRGINSHTSNQLLLRYDAHIRNLNPHIIVVQICINDLYTIPLFNDSGQEIIEGCKLNIQQIVQNAREEGATVILSTIFPVGQVPLASRLFWSDEIPLALEEVNSFIQSLADEKVVVFDAYEILTDENGMLYPDFQRDELHLNHSGYEVLNRELVHLLADLAE